MNAHTSRDGRASGHGSDARRDIPEIAPGPAGGSSDDDGLDLDLPPEMQGGADELTLAPEPEAPPEQMVPPPRSTASPSPAAPISPAAYDAAIPEMAPPPGARTAPPEPAAPKKGRGGIGGPVDESTIPKDFFEALPGAISYPFNAWGLVTIVLGGMLLMFLDLISFAPAFGYVAAIIGFGYLSAYLLSIVASSANGESTLPDWPGVLNIFEDILVPCVQMVVIQVFCFGPFYFSIMDDPTWFRNPLCLLLLVAGFAYFPMALLGVALHHTVLALNPMLLIPAMRRIPKPYAVACAVVMGASVTTGVIEIYLGEAIWAIGTALAGFVSLFFGIIEMRIIGLMYYCNREKFGWFERHE